MDNQKRPEQLTLDGFTVDSGREADADPLRPVEDATLPDSSGDDDSAAEPGAEYIVPTTDIEQFGRQTRIYVRNDIARYYVGDLCEKLEIKLIEGEGIPALDEFYLELDERFSY